MCAHVSCADGYSLGGTLLALRLVIGLMVRILLSWRIDQTQFPSAVQNFDPINNAFLSSVLLEAQLQQEKIDQSFAADLAAEAADLAAP